MSLADADWAWRNRQNAVGPALGTMGSDAFARGSFVVNLQPWGLADFFLVFIMWTVMQIAIMTPSAAPMVLTYTSLRPSASGPAKASSGNDRFLSGLYSGVDGCLARRLLLAQGGLHAATLLSPMMETTSPVLGGIILIAAGVFQFTPLKHACLSHCRTPLGFLITEWREGRLGALVMGARHGVFCVGCCWLIMALLFVAGVMNLFWIAVIAVYVLAEKLLPGGHKVSWGIGMLMIGMGHLDDCGCGSQYEYGSVRAVTVRCRRLSSVYSERTLLCGGQVVVAPVSSPGSLELIDKDVLPQQCQ